MPHGSRFYHPSQLAVTVQRRGADYTLVHAGRQLRIGPIAFWVVVGTLVIMEAGSSTTATYFASRGDVLTRLVGREAEMQFGYEDRIAELRAQIDRLSSRQLLDQEGYEQKLDQVARRQATLESHSAALNALSDPAGTGAIKAPARNGLGAPQRNGPVKPEPLSAASQLDPGTRRRAPAGADNLE